MIDEGYVKFKSLWHRGDSPAGIEDLISVRNTLHAAGLIGEYADSKIGYGNVSKRVGNGMDFVVSGTGTGNIAVATAEHFCLVTRWSLEENSVESTGPVAASSESLTHAMLYASSGLIGAVLHVHHREFWQHLLATRPHTPRSAAYGTPAMAVAMAALLQDPRVRENPVVAMAGHEEGIVAFGGNLLEAMGKLMAAYQKNGGRS